MRKQTVSPWMRITGYFARQYLVNETGKEVSYYWLSPVDLTSAALSADADLVREVLGDGKTVFLAGSPRVLRCVSRAQLFAAGKTEKSE